MTCIPHKTAQTIKKALQKGELNVDDLLLKTADEREASLLKFMSEKEAKKVNDIVTIKYRTELSDTLIDEITTKTNKINKAREGETKLSLKEWQKMSFKGKPPAWAREYVELNNKIERVLDPTRDLGFGKTVKHLKSEAVESITGKPTLPSKALRVGQLAGDVLTSAVYKSIKASFDMSYALRQGFKIFTKSPGTWKDSMVKSFGAWKNIKSQAQMDAVMNEWKAMYFAHPYYETLVNKGKLAFGAVEDFFPTTLVQKVPALGNIFKASDEAFTVFSQSSRFGLATELLEKQVKLKGVKGVAELTTKEIQALAEFANSITGRGSLGRLEASSQYLNKLFFSARFVRSQLDTFLKPFTAETDFVRKEAFKHSINTLSTIGAIMATASMFGDVETDPRSSAFGKLKIGDKTVMDLTAGLGSYIVLAFKQATAESKSAISGKITKLNDPEAYKGQTRGDVLGQWAVNKLAPAPSAINTVFLQGQDFGGKKPTVPSVATSLGIPISIENVVELMQEEEGATIILGAVADALGASTQTYTR